MYAPDPPSACTLHACNADVAPTLAINLVPDHSKFHGYGPNKARILTSSSLEDEPPGKDATLTSVYMMRK